MQFSVPACSSLWLITAIAAAASPAARANRPRGTCPDVDIGYDVSNVEARARELSSHSWEYGTLAEALLELHNPEWAVFNTAAFPDGAIPEASPDIAALAYAKEHIRLDNDTLIDGDGASGDPASLGVSAALLGAEDEAYRQAAARQAAHLLNDVPRMSNGAISHREADAEAWADFVYMAPPFLAYQAVATHNVSLLAEAVRQCGLYRDLLRDASHGYWRHILPSENGIWSTGNAWAAAGMARVLATLLHWPDAAAQLQSQRDALESWIREIVDGARSAGRDPASNLLHNYLDDASWFGETSGTALLASIVYRMAILAPASPFADPAAGYLPWADDSRVAVAQHVTGNGTLAPAVNPLGWGDRQPYTSGSPEGQSFGLLLYAAYRDYKCKCGQSGV